MVQILICRTVKCDSVRKFLRRFFQKATADPTRGALVARRNERNSFILPKRHRRVNAEPRLGRGEPHKWGVPLIQ